MKIGELLTKDTIVLKLKADTKEKVIDEIIDRLDKSGALRDKAEFKKCIMERENKFSTGIGEGVAIPHAMTDSVKKPAIAFGYSQKGIDYDSMDGQPAHIFFMIAGTASANNEHLDTVSRLSVMLLSEDFRRGISSADSEDEVLDVISKEEKKALEKEEAENAEQIKEEDLILAVTACPTGIAHTYIAADSLKNKAKEMGVNIKVETDGSSGVKNELTKEEIEKAKAVIIAADKHVETARFNGKKVIFTSTSKAIKNPEELINNSLSGDIPIYTSSEKEKESLSNETIGAQIYKHLMNGVSNMLPFVVGGGILIAVCFMFGIKSFMPGDPHYNAFSKLLHDIGANNAFTLMVPVLAGFIGMSIADRPGFAPAMVGGYIAANNGAGFIGGLIAGFLGGYSVVLLKKLFAKLPKSFDGLKPVLLYPLFGIFITGAIMYLVVVNPVKALNSGIQYWLGNMGTTNKVFLGMLLGAMMSIDMGGPVNKAAYTFGIAMIQAGNYGPQAAIMAGGMVPPLGIAIATTIFKNKFTNKERDAGKTCYVMGASFITEGAIPFAAADPIRIIASSVVGSAVTGGLSMAFNISLPAPHGGIFVIPVVNGSPWLYILSILIGSFITAFMIGILKKPVAQE